MPTVQVEKADGRMRVTVSGIPHLQSLTSEWYAVGENSDYSNIGWCVGCLLIKVEASGVAAELFPEIINYIMKAVMEYVEPPAAVDNLIDELASRINQRSDYAHLYTAFTDTPGLRLELCCTKCSRWRITHVESGESLIHELVFQMLPAEKLRDKSSVERLAYWLSLLDVKKNMRWNAESGQVQLRGDTRERYLAIISGWIKEDDKMVADAIAG